jgi:putative ABC transport system permease protein
MRVPFPIALAWRESRASGRRLVLLTASVAAGVAALVAIHSFRANVETSVREQARGLLGADLVLGSANPFSATAEAALVRMVDAVKGTELARVRSFTAMAYVAGREGSHLVQAVAIEGDYPFYGRGEPEPPGGWARLKEGGGVLVDPSLLTRLDARVGDELALGEARLAILGTVPRMPGDVGIRSAVGPRVYLAARDATATGLITFGSRVRYEAFLKVPGARDAMRLAERHRKLLSAERVSLRTVTEDQQALSQTLGRLGRYLGLVALMALLLGGLGVASAVHVFIQRRLETIAVLRCLGASSGQLLASYLLQAGLLGLAGGAVGAAIGAGLQSLLPRLLRGLLPITVSSTTSWSAVGGGIALGVGTAVLFALIPLAALRAVAPLRALRRDLSQDGAGRRDPLRVGAAVLLVASIWAMALVEAPNRVNGTVFAVVILLAVGLLWLAAALLSRAARRFFPGGAPYPVRQGVANLFRPANQTRMVVVALGFGAFLIGTVYLVQHNILERLRVDTDPTRPNLALFDIQPHQRQALEEDLARAGHRGIPAVPIVPMRIASVKGVPAAKVLARTGPPPGPGRSAQWAFRREFRSTYRDRLMPSETQVAGQAWAPGAGLGGAPGAVVPISVEEELASDLGVRVGDEIVWDVQGLTVPSRVASLRTVVWTRLEPNFFVVFPEGPLNAAPQTFLTLTRVDDANARARLQRQLIERFPNVTVLDLSQVQQALEEIVGRVSVAIRFMALFSLITGAVVLTGALASSRTQRLRETVLLKTLGASRRQLMTIAFTEHLALGGLAALCGVALAVSSAWGLVRILFEQSFSVPWLPLLLLASLVVALTVAVGLLSSAAVFRRPSLELLRSE